jgi:hypothetical protein
MDPLPDHIEIELIKGFLPNYITARAEIADLKNKEIVAAAAEGREPREVVYCQYCGRQMKNKQSLKGHLHGCKGRGAANRAKTEGIAFAVGLVTFVVRSDRIKVMLGLEEEERVVAKQIASGIWDQKNALLAFQRTLVGAGIAQAEGALTYDVLHPEKEGHSDVSDSDMSPLPVKEGIDDGPAAVPS